MRKYGILSLFLTGCTTLQNSVPRISSEPVRADLEQVAGSTHLARDDVRRARAALGVAETKTSELLRTAAPTECGALGGIKASLLQSHTELDATLNSLAVAQGALTDSESKVQTLQSEIDKQTAALRCAEESAAREKASADFWRSVALKVSLLTLALVLWTFRKPIAALFGVPLV